MLQRVRAVSRRLLLAVVVATALGLPLARTHASPVDTPTATATDTPTAKPTDTPTPTFTPTPTPGSTSCVPSLVSPEEGTVLDNGRTDRLDDVVWDFDWSDCEGASRYHLYVLHPGATFPLIDDANVPVSYYHDVGAGAYIIEANRFGWTWKVRAMAGGEWGEWSETRTFDVEPVNTDPPLPSSLPSTGSGGLLDPGNNALRKPWSLAAAGLAGLAAGGVLLLSGSGAWYARRRRGR